ncbi:MAG TPA: CerR family C-terminal domain-containing protein [Planctomycetota bacterium]|nr:CerR family C-terminal domain-containing protein [Planctomycetota bacterium]
MPAAPVDDTRQRLLDSAGEVFASRGFRAATVREICSRAGANVAAVNYHFGGKEELYAAVLRYAHRCASERFPDAPAAGNGDPEERLRAWVRTTVGRVYDEGRPAWHGRLWTREMVEPTPALDAIVEQGIRPRFAELRSIVKRLLPPRASEREIWHAAVSVVSQCLFFRHAEPVVRRLNPSQRFRAGELEAFADHVTRFSIAALRAKRGAR